MCHLFHGGTLNDTVTICNVVFLKNKIFTMQEWEFSFGVPFTFLWKPVNSKFLAYPEAVSQLLLKHALSSSPVSTMSITVTQKSYKVFTSSRWRLAAVCMPGTGISSSAFFQVGSSSSSWGWSGHQHEYSRGLQWGQGHRGDHSCLSELEPAEFP